MRLSPNFAAGVLTLTPLTTCTLLNLSKILVVSKYTPPSDATTGGVAEGLACTGGSTSATELNQLSLLGHP